MYAIIESGGKQHRVTPGEEIAVERLDGEPGAKVKFDKVLLVTTDKGTQVGQPHVAGAVVQATVLAQDRDRKIVIFKKKRRKKFRKKQGHRQSITRLVIDKIDAKGNAPKAAAKAKPKAEAAPEAETA